MAYQQHTHCVNRSDYTPLAPGVLAAALVAIVGIIAGGPIGAIVALIGGYWALSQVCAYLLGGKLVCLDHDQCAIGRVMELEPAGYNKSFPNNIDNDYGVDLLLAPHLPPGTPEQVDATRAEIEGDGSQGKFMKEQPQSAGLGFVGYTTDQDLYYPEDRGGGGPPQQLKIPVLHCEFEGSRIDDF